jgi:hypothetical protein
LEEKAGKIAEKAGPKMLVKLTIEGEGRILVLKKMMERNFSCC